MKRFEDRGGFVYLRAQDLEDMYDTATSGISAWSRDVIYVRPQLFVVYDRTTTSGGDAHLKWHFAPTPTLGSAGSTYVRYNVLDGSIFKGALTTIIPASATVAAPTNMFSSNKLYRLTVRGPSASGDLRWLTVLDASSVSTAVDSVSRVQGTNYNGVVLSNTGGTNKAVLLGVGAVDVNIPGTITYSQPAAATTLIVTDLPGGSKYNVTASGSPTHTVTITPNTSGTFTVSESGTLYVNIAANGATSTPPP